MTGAPRPAEANAKLGATVFVAVLVVGLGFAAWPSGDTRQRCRRRARGGW
jgi:hypothetical protein